MHFNNKLNLKNTAHLMLASLVFRANFDTINKKQTKFDTIMKKHSITLLMQIKS